ncbi:MAG: nucleotidyltransferase family protein [Pirellulales bacterium]|nr:nucleotidyltransferase family protein [Pirellulales bacterium]
MQTYESQLNADLDWALREGSMHFEGESAVHKTLRRIAQHLGELGVDYAIAGGMALFFHGYRRFTEDVDVLVTPEGLAKIHEHLEGSGYVRPFEKSKNLRDAVTGVKIDFLITGGYPGDGKPGPVAFPVPADVSIESGGCAF